MGTPLFSGTQMTCSDARIMALSRDFQNSNEHELDHERAHLSGALQLNLAILFAT